MSFPPASTASDHPCPRHAQRPDGTAVYSEDEDAEDFEVINRKTVTTSTRSDARPWQDTQESLFIYVGYHVLSYVSFRRRD